MKKRILSAGLALLLVASLPVTAFADTYDLANGSVEVSATENGQSVTQGSTYVSNDPAPVITSNGTSTQNTVTIKADANQTANVTLRDVNIDVSTTGGYDVATRSFKAGDAAVSTSGAGNVTIELDGGNTVKSGYYRAGLEKKNTGSLIITDANNDSGSLDAAGGDSGAGIGGGWKGSGSDITVTDAEVTATGGWKGAGIGGGSGGSGSNITLSGSTVDATGGHYAAGIGGGDNGSGSGITITGSAVDAKGGNYGAGIGGGSGGSGSNITLSDSDVTAQGGAYGAGVGGGSVGSGSGITITGSAVDAKGGYYGAGIGGGIDGSGSNITLTGSAVDAQGGKSSAGIGGGIGGSGSNITLTGGTTKAAGGDGGAGIGGGRGADGSGITVSGDAQVKVQGGEEFHGDFGTRIGAGAGAAIGNGGDVELDWDTHTETLMRGAEVTPDVSELTAEGKIEYYAPGADMEKDAPIEDQTVIGEHVHEWDKGVVTKEPTCTETGVRIDTCISGETKSFTRTVELPLLEHEFKDYVSDNNASYTKDGTKTAKCVWYDQCGKTHTVQDEGSRLIRSETAPLYRVTDADGRGVNYKAERKDGVLTVTVDADFAVLTGTLDGISTLKAQGVEKIVFVTKSAKSTFALADLLEKGSRGETYKLTHDGKTVTFTLGAKMTDVSAILEKA